MSISTHFVSWRRNAATPRKDYRSLQDEEQRRQRAQDEIQQRLLEEGARVKALEALKHREEETIQHVTWQ